MDVTETMIGRFFENEATPEEAELVLAYFDRHPAEMDKYAAAMEQYSSRERLHPALSRNLFEKIESNLQSGNETGGAPAIHDQATGRRSSIYYRLAAAAVLILLTASVWLLFRTPSRHKEENVVAQATPPSLIRVMNSSDTVMRLALNDGSSVELAQNSGISYYEPFINDRRDISLKGTALFTVAKDKKRSFTVYADGVATTALGTQFRVKAPGTNERVTVQLYEGKVVVKQVNGSEMNYLQPGQQLVFDGLTQQMTLARIEENAVGSKSITGVPHKTNPGRSDEDLVFKDQPFEAVIASLEKEYHARIRYESPAAKKINITAEFKHTETLSGILNTIAALNGLTVSQQGNTYTIQ